MTDYQAEWLETDGRGGFACGTVGWTRSRRFVAPLLRHLDEAGLGHISEFADAEAPRAPRGCPWQAWLVGEALRLTERVLAGCQGMRPD